MPRYISQLLCPRFPNPTPTRRFCCSHDQDVGYTGETAEYFQLFHVTSRVERFEAELEQRKAAMSTAAAPAPAATSTPKKGGKSKSKSKKSAKKSEEEEEVVVVVAAAAGPAAGGGLVKELFPFHGFFANAPAGDKLFGGKDLEEDLEVARGCFRHISKVGQHSLLGRCWPFVVGRLLVVGTVVVGRCCCGYWWWLW